MPEAMSAAERGLTNAVKAFRSDLSGQAAIHGTYGRRRAEAARDLSFALKRFGRNDLDADDVLEDLIEKKSVFLVKGMIRPALRGQKRTREEAQAAFEEFVTSVAERATGHEEGRRLLKKLIRRMSRLHGVHKISGKDGPGIFIATGMDFVSGEPTATKGVAAVCGPRGLQFFKIKSDRIRLEWHSDWPSFTIDFEDLKADRKRSKDLRDARLVGKASNTMVNESWDSSRALRSLYEQRDRIEAYIGLTLEGHKWNGLKMSLRRGKHLGRMIQTSLLGLLNPEIRRIALRNPYATHGFYQSVKTGNKETIRRRAQMSEAYPLFTMHIQSLDETITKGEPLLPALSKLTGLDIPRLKRLRGIHWQRFGSSVCELIDDSDNFSYSGLSRLMKIDPERVPTSKKEWQAFSFLSKWEMIEYLPEEKRQAAMIAVSKNWLGYYDLCNEDFSQAISDTAQTLVTLIDHHVSTAKRKESATKVLKQAIFHHIAGENFGVKRLRLFNDLWHKGVGRRTAQIREIRKAVFGEERIAKWKPLTETSFECEFGRLVWLVDELELQEEGSRMHHCVASYWTHCADGESHIAQVHGSDGSRSTVEFGVGATGLFIKQHHTYYDKPPSDTCDGVVRLFMKANKETKFEVADGDRGNKHDERREKASEEVVAALMRAYEDCLPMSFMEKINERGRKWREENPDISLELAEEARSARIKQIQYRNSRGASIPIPEPITF